MKKHLVILGIIISIALSISAANGLCEDYIGKTFPSDLLIKMASKNSQGQCNKILGKIKHEEDRFQVYFECNKESGRYLLDWMVIRLDTDYWVAGKEVVKK